MTRLIHTRMILIPSLPPSIPPPSLHPSLGWCMNFAAMAALAAVGTPSITSLLPLVRREGGREGEREGGREGGREWRPQLQWVHLALRACCLW